MSNHVFAQAQSDGEIRFEEDIRPILTEHCASCHGGVKKQGGFSVLSRSLLLAETDSGQPAVVPAHAESSELLRRVRSSDPGDQMPPQGHDRLSPQEIQDLEHWIQQGVTWPEHWAYQPLSKTTAQLTSNDGDASSIGQPLIDGINPVDWFVHKRLAQQELQPSEQAGRRILLRRLSLDLTGLNPLPEELKSFEENELPDAFISQVDRLLASPHFGERWARHWLDEARYADSEGYEKDSVKNDAWRFRDWVIRAINDDMPFDEFTRRQIAGDLLPDATDDDRIATQFHLQAQFNLEGGVDAEEDRTKRVIDRVGTVSSVWLGSSLACCQCHDHPYDSFRQRDFYAMYAFFNNADFAADFLGDVPANADKLREERKAKWSKIADLLRRQVDDKNLSDDVQSQLSSLRSYDNSKGFTRYLTERKTDKRKTWVFTRGDFLQPDQAQGDIVPNVPSVLPGAFDDTVDRNRLDLAEWLVSTENPLTARVEVNKVWMHLFGQALTDQPQEFGSRGSAPSHPELLDFLASWFMHEGGWSRKKLIRLIVSSETWRQSSVVRPELIAHDPNNHLLARQNRFRVEAEIVRDLSLQVSGLLTDEIGGPSVFPPLPSIIAEQTYAGSFKFKASEGADRYRRGLYTFFRRTAIDPNLSTFDCPDSSLTSAQRDRSNNPLQALAALHNEVFHEAAQAFSVRLLTEGESAPESSAIIDRALVLTSGRHAYEMEKEQLLELQQAARIHYMSHPEDAIALCGQYTTDRVSQPELAAWIATMRIVLNMDEFLTRS
ncbi:MAG: PSD1 domain-containing protein [Planctomycetaceae bacterium]|nr:PSD1 domain-containing protein [Planctomycetaceae bacterium]